MNVKIADVLKDPKWPEEPFFRPTDWQRQDESSDTSFYSSPRFVTHIDDPAIKALTGSLSHVSHRTSKISFHFLGMFSY
jgi:hypothetical protein